MLFLKCWIEAYLFYDIIIIDSFWIKIYLYFLIKKCVGYKVL